VPTQRKKTKESVHAAVYIYKTKISWQCNKKQQFGKSITLICKKTKITGDKQKNKNRSVTGKIHKILLPIDINFTEFLNNKMNNKTNDYLGLKR